MAAALRGIMLAGRSSFKTTSIGVSSTPISTASRLVPMLVRARISTSTSRPQGDASRPLDKSSSMDWTANSPPSTGIPPIPPAYHSKLPPRLGSTAGRSVAVRGGDVAGAFMQLKRICFENSIARDASAQRFYERPGMKKKRLRRERYRRRFKESFKRMVSTVLEMKRQGI